MSGKKILLGVCHQLLTLWEKKKTKEKFPKVAFFRERINVHPNGSQAQKCSVA